AVFDPCLERPRQLYLEAAAETEPAGVLLELAERTGRGEGGSVERGVADLAVSGDAGCQRHAGAGADVILSIGLEPLARAGEAVGELRRAAAGRQLALDADEQAAEAQVVTGRDAVDRGIGIGGDRAIGGIDLDAFVAAERAEVEAAGLGRCGAGGQSGRGGGECENSLHCDSLCGRGLRRHPRSRPAACEKMNWETMRPNGAAKGRGKVSPSRRPQRRPSTAR